jgi:ABC-type dipeptide/oligopeptide/nickel transport system ATPase component
MSDEIPTIKPIKLKEYEVKQSKYNVVSKLPMRAVILGPSGSGKSILLQNFIMDIYHKCFSRIYIFSPSINVDYQTWQPVKDMITKEITNNDDEQFYFDHYNEEALMNIITTQRKIIEYQKKQNHNKLFSILIVVDDFADDVKFSRNSKLLHSLFTRGRHSQISTIVATQKFNALSPIIRVNASDLYVFRLRNYSDLQAFMDEVSAIAPKDVILEMYKLATDEPFSFLTVKLTSKDKNKIFMIRFDKQLTFD